MKSRRWLGTNEAPAAAPRQQGLNIGMEVDDIAHLTELILGIRKALEQQESEQIRLRLEVGHIADMLCAIQNLLAAALERSPDDDD